jgi:SAM-dependent methyltransferase
VPTPSAPLPPADLAARVGPGPGSNALEAYEREGANVRTRLERMLPPRWSYDGKRILDFGCGSARVLRHFLPEADSAEFWGCDIDGPSVDWVKENLSPPFKVFQNQLVPPLDVEAGTFDLVWATSVFTHIAAWSGWLLEVHRVLADDGLLVATFLGEGVWQEALGEPYREDEVGMTVLKHWVGGGPGSEVFHSEWWLREHWGRAFDVLEVVRPPRLDDGSPQVTHSYIALRKRPVTITQQEIEAPNVDDPRELAGLQTTIRLLRREIDTLVADQPLGAMVKATAREAVLRSPLAEPARSVRRWLRARRSP